MRLFSRLKVAMGIGNPTLSVQLENTQVKRGGKIKGKLMLTGVSGKVPVTGLLVEFVEVIAEHQWDDVQEKTVERKNEKGKMGNVVIEKNGYLLKKNETITETFEIAVSTGVWPTAHPTSYILKASANMPGLGPKSQLDVFII